MRLAAVIAALSILAPAVGSAAESVEQTVNKAILALNSTCYEARMSYLSQFDEGQLQQVYIIHVAPDLYHVKLLEQGKEVGPYFIENAQELVQMQGTMVKVMPKRRFSTNDALTAKFLRDLGSYPGSTILEGMVGDYDVWVVRQDASPEKPYLITVGLDKRNYFPLFLLVNDAGGERRVYYEMEAIEYKSASEIKDSWFKYSDDTSNRAPSPRINELPPQQFDTQGSREEGYSVLLRSPSAALEDGAGQAVRLPLFPTNLPDGYRLEAITLLGYSPLADFTGDEAVVYQLEIYGPRGDLLSVFQTHLEEPALEPGHKVVSGEQRFVLEQVNGWLRAAFGNVPVSQLEWVLDGLTIDDERVRQLLEETKARDLIIQQVIEAPRD